MKYSTTLLWPHITLRQAMAVVEGLLRLTLGAIHASIWLREAVYLSLLWLWTGLAYALKHKGSKLECIQEDTKELKKIPQHLTLIIHEEKLSPTDLAKVVTWAFASGIHNVSIYTSQGEHMNMYWDQAVHISYLRVKLYMWNIALPFIGQQSVGSFINNYLTCSSPTHPLPLNTVVSMLDASVYCYKVWSSINNTCKHSTIYNINILIVCKHSIKELDCVNKLLILLYRYSSWSCCRVAQGSGLPTPTDVQPPNPRCGGIH